MVLLGETIIGGFATREAIIGSVGGEMGAKRTKDIESKSNKNNRVSSGRALSQLALGDGSGSKLQRKRSLRV